MEVVVPTRMFSMRTVLLSTFNTRTRSTLPSIYSARQYVLQARTQVYHTVLACKILGVNSVYNHSLLLVEEHFIVHNLFFYMHMKHHKSTPSQKHKSTKALPSTPPPPLCRLINLQNSPRPRQRRHPCVIIIVIVIVIIVFIISS